MAEFLDANGLNIYHQGVKQMVDGVLPSITSTDEGKVLVVNENGEWVAGEVTEAQPKVFSCYTGTPAGTANKIVTFRSDVPSSQDILDGAIISVHFSYSNTNTLPSLSVTTSDGVTYLHSIRTAFYQSVTKLYSGYTVNSKTSTILYLFKRSLIDVGSTTYPVWELIGTDPSNVILTRNPSIYPYFLGDPIPVIPDPGSSYSNKVLKATGSNTWDWSTLLPTVNSSSRYKYLTNDGTDLYWDIVPAPTIREVPYPSSGDQGKALIASGENTYGWDTVSATVSNEEYYDYYGNLHYVNRSVNNFLSPIMWHSRFANNSLTFTDKKNYKQMEGFTFGDLESSDTIIMECVFNSAEVSEFGFPPSYQYVLDKIFSPSGGINITISIDNRTQVSNPYTDPDALFNKRIDFSHHYSMAFDYEYSPTRYGIYDWWNYDEIPMYSSSILTMHFQDEFLETFYDLYYKPLKMCIQASVKDNGNNSIIFKVRIVRIEVEICGLKNINTGLDVTSPINDLNLCLGGGESGGSSHTIDEIDPSKSILSLSGDFLKIELFSCYIGIPICRDCELDQAILNGSWSYRYERTTT